jgi:hypothetical protein
MSSEHPTRVWATQDGDEITLVQDGFGGIHTITAPAADIHAALAKLG